MRALLSLLTYAAMSAMCVAWVLDGPFAYVGDMAPGAATTAEFVAFLAPALLLKALGGVVYLVGTR